MSLLVVCSPMPATMLVEELSQLYPGATITPFGACPEREQLYGYEYCTIDGGGSVAEIEEQVDAAVWIAGDSAGLATAFPDGL